MSSTAAAESVLILFENTPKAFANSSPGLERSDNLGDRAHKNLKP
jgi:hypothetical protein